MKKNTGIRQERELSSFDHLIQKFAESQKDVERQIRWQKNVSFTNAGSTKEKYIYRGQRG